jgi:hypothetical protein
MDRTVGNRPAQISERSPKGVTQPGGPLAMRVEMTIRITDQLNLVVHSMGPVQADLIPIVEAIEIH